MRLQISSSPGSPPTWKIAPLLLAAALAAGCGESPPPPEAASPRAAPPAAAREAQPRFQDATDPETRRERLRAQLRAGWWNNAKQGAAIGLTGEQTKVIDEIMLAYLVGEFENREFRDTTQRFRERLAAGDSAGARVAADAKAAAAAASLRRQSESIIRALEVLTPEQRGRLVERFPGLLERPWIRVQSTLRTAARSQQPSQPEPEDGGTPPE